MVIPFFQSDVLAGFGFGLWVGSPELFWMLIDRKQSPGRMRGNLSETAKNKRTVQLNYSCIINMNTPRCLRELKSRLDVSVFFACFCR